MHISIPFILLIILFFENRSNAQISRFDLLGKWEMSQVYQGEAEVTHQYFPDANRWIEFNSDFTFVSNGEPYGKKEGRFTLNENTGLLSFSMDLGFGQHSYWYAEIDGEKMIWTDRGNPFINKIKVILVPKY